MLDERLLVLDRRPGAGLGHAADDLVAGGARAFPRHEPAVELEDHHVGNEIDPETPADRPQAERRRTAGMIGSAGEELPGERLDRQCRPGGRIDRVVAALREGAVTGPPPHSNPPPHRSLMHADDIEAGRLGDDSRHRPGSPDEIAGRAVAGAHHASATPQRGDRPGPGEAELLVDRRREQDCDRAVLRGAEKPLKPDDHGCHPPLHVARPPPLEPAVADQRKERVDRHSLDGHGVLVGIPENGRSPGDCRLETGQDVVAAGGDRLPGPGEASGAEALHEIVGDPTLEVLRPRDVTPHRVDTGATDEVGKRRQGICHG